MINKRIIALIIISMLVCLIGIVFFMSTTVIESITVEGNEHMSREQILAVVGFSDTSTVLDVLTHRVTHMSDISYISKLEVEYPSLRTINIHVYEKDIIGYVLYMGKYICIDASGYIVDYTSSPDPLRPKIQGVDLSAFTIDKPIEVSEKIVRTVDMIYRNSLAFDMPIEWIDFQFLQGNQIIIKKGGIEIRIGDATQLEEKFSAIKEVLKVLPEGKKGILYAENVKGDLIFKSIEAN